MCSLQRIMIPKQCTKKVGPKLNLYKACLICIIFVTLTCFHLTYFFREEKCSRLKTKWPFHFQKRINFLVKLQRLFKKKKPFISHEEGSTLIFSSHKRIRQMKAFQNNKCDSITKISFLVLVWVP